MSEFILGDCMDYLPDYPDNYFDLAIVDPPYGGAYNGDGTDITGGGRFGQRFDRYKHDIIPSESESATALTRSGEKKLNPQRKKS